MSDIRLRIVSHFYSAARPSYLLALLGPTHKWLVLCHVRVNTVDVNSNVLALASFLILLLPSSSSLIIINSLLSRHHHHHPTAPSLALALETGTPVALLAVGFLAPTRFHPFSLSCSHKFMYLRLII